MFKSLFSLFGQVVKLFSTTDREDQADAQTQKNNQEGSDTSTDSDVSPDNESTLQLSSQLEVDEVDVLSGDWGNALPQRASALFPQTLPNKSEKPAQELMENDGAKHLKEFQDRETPSPDQLFEEASANIPPQKPLEKPDRPLLKSVVPEPLPVVAPAPKARHYHTHIQVGRLMKQDPEPPMISPVPQRAPELIHSGKKGRQRFIQSLDRSSDAQGQTRRPLPPPPRVGQGQPFGHHKSDKLDYHDVRGERGVASRAQLHEPTGRVDVFSESPLPTNPINRGSLSLPSSSLVELSAPPLKPKPVRFKKGNYMRFWGNYSAQPSYLHFGSLIRSERFIELLPIWYNELDELENEAREEWAHLEDESPLEGEADWRRLLNPTMSSPIDFLLHRDRVDHLSAIHRGL